MSDRNVSSQQLIDWDLLMGRLGDEELVNEILPIFISDGQERMEKLTSAVQSQDCREIKFYAHAIKGSSGTIGAAALSAATAELENAARDEDMARTGEIFSQVKELFEQLVEFLARDDWKTIAKQQAANKER